MENWKEQRRQFRGGKGQVKARREGRSGHFVFGGGGGGGGGGRGGGRGGGGGGGRRGRRGGHLVFFTDECFQKSIEEHDLAAAGHEVLVHSKLSVLCHRELQEVGMVAALPKHHPHVGHLDTGGRGPCGRSGEGETKGGRRKEKRKRERGERGERREGERREGEGAEGREEERERLKDVRVGREGSGLLFFLQVRGGF